MKITIEFNPAQKGSGWDLSIDGKITAIDTTGFRAKYLISTYVNHKLDEAQRVEEKAAVVHPPDAKIPW